MGLRSVSRRAMLKAIAVGTARATAAASAFSALVTACTNAVSGPAGSSDPDGSSLPGDDDAAGGGRPDRDGGSCGSRTGDYGCDPDVYGYGYGWFVDDRGCGYGYGYGYGYYGLDMTVPYGRYFTYGRQCNGTRVSARDPMGPGRVRHV